MANTLAYLALLQVMKQKKFYDIDTCTRDKKIDKHSSLLAKRSIMHRDKTRVQTHAKMFPHLKLLCWLFMDPALGFDTKQQSSFLIKFGVFFTIKTRF